MINTKLCRSIFFTMLIFSLISCQGQNNKEKNNINTKSIIGGSPLILDTLSFDLDVLHFYSNKQIFNGTEETIGFRIEKDTVFEDGYNEESRKPLMIQYDQTLTSLKDTLAIFGSQPFCKINTLTMLDSKLMAIHAKTKDINKNDSDKFLDFLTKKYGQYEKDSIEYVKEKWDVYLWKLSDKVIQYMPIPSQSGRLNYSINNNNEINEKEKPEPFYEGYIYIVKNEFVDKIDNLISSGEFIHFRPNHDDQ